MSLHFRRMHTTHTPPTHTHHPPPIALAHSTPIRIWNTRTGARGVARTDTARDPHAPFVVCPCVAFMARFVVVQVARQHHTTVATSRLALYVQSIFSLMASLLSVNAPLDVPMCPPCTADGACGTRTPTHKQRAAHTRRDFAGCLLWPEPWGSRPMSVRHRKEGPLAFPKRPSCRLYDENWSFYTRRRGCGGFAGTQHERGGRRVGSDFPRPVSPM